MSTVVPSSIPAKSTAGEKALHALLGKLPEGCIAYYEPEIHGRHPDFVVILPTHGLLVIEVKGWYPTHVHSGDKKHVRYQRGGLTSVEKHPQHQAWGYVTRLLDEVKRPIYAAMLIHQEGTHQGKPRFPIGHVAVLSNMSDAQLDEQRPGCAPLRQIFPPKANVSRDELQRWITLSPEALLAEFARYFDPRWPITPMAPPEITALRGLIHPEIFFDPTQNPETIEASPERIRENPALLKALDLQQEDFASGIGSGHRIIHGVAGSGKTLILLAHAKAVVTARPESRVLLTCFNRTLAAWLRFQLEGFPAITVIHIHSWASRNGVPYQPGRHDSSLGEALLTNLRTGSRDTATYDTILIDEAQDLDPAFFPCLLAAMKDPVDGDLVIVADGSQSLYQRRKFSWSQYGIKARGRTISTRFELHRNYRNSKEIATLATSFLTAAEADPTTDTDTAILSLRVDPAQSIITTGAKPTLTHLADRRSELSYAAQAIKGLLAGHWQGRPTRPLQPEEIGILYPSSRENEKRLLVDFTQYLNKRGIPTTWLNDPKNPSSAEDIATTGVKLQTIHSAKGLQYRAAIIIWADKLPATHDLARRRIDRRLLYVGITRAESFLAITASGTSSFIQEIAESGATTQDSNTIPPRAPATTIALVS